MFLVVVAQLNVLLFEFCLFTQQKGVFSNRKKTGWNMEPAPLEADVKATFTETKNGWSTGRFSNVNVPTYLPPEALLLEEGQFVKAFLHRCLLHDLNRLVETKSCEEFLANKEIEAEYDKIGNRVNTPENIIQEKKTKVMQELTEMLKRHRDMLAGAVTAAAPAKELVMKRYFSAEEMAQGAYGAILGARGTVHQSLERETKCKIVLAGRGITDLRKDTSDVAVKAAEEEPHARISAPNEKALQECVQKIDWILSDDPSAHEFRENNRRKMANADGKAYVPIPREAMLYKKPSSGGAAAGGDDRKRGRDENVAPEVDQDVMDFFDS